MVLRRLPEAQEPNPTRTREKKPDIHQRLLQKGLPTIAFSKLKLLFGFHLKKFWHFMLEAKDLKSQGSTGYKIKKIFGIAAKNPKKIPVTQNSSANLNTEKDYLDAIKKDPKNLDLYDLLGKFYVENQNYSDAKDIYLYLNSHSPANPDFHAKLGFVLYKTGEYQSSAECYEKSLSLDSSHPNRYYNLSLVLMALEKNDRAKEMMVKALELEPENPKYQAAIKKIN